MMIVVSYCIWACCMHAYRFCYIKKYLVFLDKNVANQASSTASSFSGGQISARKLDIWTEFRYVSVFETGNSLTLQMKLLLISACFPFHHYLTNLLFNAVFFEILRVLHCGTRRKVAGSIFDGVLDVSFT
jgi:hypothetical protein